MSIGGQFGMIPPSGSQPGGGGTVWNVTITRQKEGASVADGTLAQMLLPGMARTPLRAHFNSHRPVMWLLPT